MIINKAISMFRLKLSLWDDDSKWTDEALYEVIINNAAITLSRYIEKGFKMSPLMWSTYGIKLQMVNADMFPCEDIEHCKLLESTFTIPDFLMARNTPLFRVMYKGSELPSYSSSNQFNPIKSTLPSWEVVNQKLRIHNLKTLKGIEVKGIWTNELDWLEKKYCPSTETVECYDLDSLNIAPLSDVKFREMTFTLCLQSLGFAAERIAQGQNENSSH